MNVVKLSSVVDVACSDKKIFLRLATHVFPCDGADVIHIFYLSLVLDHSHSDGILTNLRGNVALNLEAQVFEHQVSFGHAAGIKRKLQEKKDYNWNILVLTWQMT